MLSDTLAKERWAEGKGSTTLLLPRLQPHGSGSLSPLKGMEVSADPRALSTVIFAENPTLPNRIGTQRGYFESWMIEKPEASFLCCLKTDEALTHLINHIWGMQRSKNNLRFSQILKKTLASRLCTNTVSCCYDTFWWHNITVSLQHWGCHQLWSKSNTGLSWALHTLCLVFCSPTAAVQEQYMEFAHRKGRPRVSSAPNMLNRISSPRTAYLSVLALNDSIIPYDTGVFWHENLQEVEKWRKPRQRTTTATR